MFIDRRFHLRPYETVVSTTREALRISINVSLRIGPSCTLFVVVELATHLAVVHPLTTDHVEIR
jgi:hypothetical protein